MTSTLLGKRFVIVKKGINVVFYYYFKLIAQSVKASTTDLRQEERYKFEPRPQLETFISSVHLVLFYNMILFLNIFSSLFCLLVHRTDQGLWKRTKSIDLILYRDIKKVRLFVCVKNT